MKQSIINILGGAIVGAIFASVLFFNMTRDENTVSVRIVQTVQNANNF